MIHIHPFPARMAPDVVLKGLESVPEHFHILDPMSGSGMVLGTAAKLGVNATGYDLDPLACMISRANGTRINEEKVRAACEELLNRCEELYHRKVSLSWIDEDPETSKYVDFWFGGRQQKQLRLLSHLLVSEPFISNKKILDLLRVATSRLIVTKEPKASLARDTAHSRPHRTLTENTFDVLASLPKSVEHVLRALDSRNIKTDARAFRGDARKLGRTPDESIDCIITSPPYLNAIDYMRGHRLSLVWLGYRVSDLRKTRATSADAEIHLTHCSDERFRSYISSIDPDVRRSKERLVSRYFSDLCQITDAAFRVLRRNRTATYVIGDSTIKGEQIENSYLLKIAAERSGFRIRSDSVREIPEHHRYLPLLNSARSSLGRRMRSERVLVFEKRRVETMSAR